MAKSVSVNGGIGFGGLLTVAFIVLKLTEYIGWSWWWVLSPLWIALGVGMALIVIVSIGLFVAWVCTRAIKKEERL